MSSSLPRCLGRAVACDCGTHWIFLLPFFQINVTTSLTIALTLLKMIQYFVKRTRTVKLIEDVENRAINVLILCLKVCIQYFTRKEIKQANSLIGYSQQDVAF